MGSGCMYSPAAFGCVDVRAPVRATYVNLYRWPESDAEFVKSVSSGEQRRRHHHHQSQYQYQTQPRVVDSYSCRQMYLRSYTFSRKETETVPKRARKCLGRVKDKVAAVAADGKGVRGCLPWGGGGAGASGVERSVGTVHTGGRVRKKAKQKRCLVIRRVRDVSAAALRSIFRRLLSCTAAVDVADHQPS